jgi:glyoxylase I family protein
MAIHGVHHTSISTRDHEKMVWFYRDICGIPEAITQRWEVGSPDCDKVVGLKDSAAYSVLLATDNMFVELFHYVTPAGKPVPENRPVCDAGLTHICFDVTDIHYEYNRMVEAGIKFHCAPTEIEGVGWTTYGRDPDGNIFEIQEIIDVTSRWRLGMLRQSMMNVPAPEPETVRA